MTSRKEFANSFLTNDLKREENKVTAAKRKAISASGGNCLMCKHTKLAVGKRLICKLKDKLVTQYNYCEHFAETKPEGDNDD